MNNKLIDFPNFNSETDVQKFNNPSINWKKYQLSTQLIINSYWIYIFFNNIYEKSNQLNT